MERNGIKIKKNRFIYLYFSQIILKNGAVILFEREATWFTF